MEQCVRDWLDSLTIDDETIAQYRGQAEKWIYPKIGKAKLKTLSAKDVERFFNDCGQVLSKRSLVGLKSTLRRSIRRAQRHDLIGRNVADLVDLPEGQPGRPSRAMTEQQAAKVLGAATGKPIGYVTVVKVGNYRQAATHAATEAGQLACGTRPRKNATIQHISTDLADTTCHHCRNQLGLDGTHASDGRLEALFVLAITLGLRPGELRALTWDHVNLDQGIIHVWRSARKGGDTKTPQSRRSLMLPKRAIDALTVHKKRQAAERLRSGRGLAGQQPRVLPRERRPVHPRRAQLALQPDHPPGRHRPLARPRGPPHGGVHHEQQRRPDPGDLRHRGPQVHPRHRDRLPARDRARHQGRRNDHG